MSHRNPAARALGVCLVLSLVAIVPAAAAGKPSPAELAAYADQLLAANYPADGPGAAALVVADGKVVLRKGYGLASLEHGVPVKPETVFEIGSVTKQFTAAAILKLAEQGKLALDDDVTKHLPDYPTHGRKITVEHLLLHTSGIPSYTDLPEWLPRVREDLKLEQLVGLFKDKDLEFEPGTRWVYSNSAYVLLGAIIEKVSGKTYEDYVEQEIFAPLGLKGTRYGSQKEVVPGRATGYDKGVDGGFRVAEYLSMTQPHAAGSLISTIDDLWTWDQALESGKVISKASLAKMLTPYQLPSGLSTHYGFGWGVNSYAGHRLRTHGGGIFGFVSDVLALPDDGVYVAILSNHPGAQQGPGDLSFRIAARAIGKALEDRPKIVLGEQALGEYVAVYRFDEKTTRTITREGAKLFAQRSGGEKQEVYPAARDEFFYGDSNTRLRFRRDAAGKVAAVEFYPSAGPDAVGERTDEQPAAERQAIQVDPALYDAYAGVYELAPGFEIAITREGNQIFGQATGQPKFEMFPQAETEFFLKVVDAQVTFERGPDGKATGLVLHQGGRDMPGKKVK